MNVAVQSAFPVQAAAVKPAFAGSVNPPNDVARSNGAGPQLEPAHLSRPPTFAEVARRILLAKPTAGTPGKTKPAQPKAADIQPAVKANEPAANAGLAAANNVGTLATVLVAFQPTVIQPIAVQQNVAPRVLAAPTLPQPVFATPGVPEQSTAAVAPPAADTSKPFAASSPLVAVAPGESPALPATADQGRSQPPVRPVLGTASADASKLSTTSSPSIQPENTGKNRAANLTASATAADESSLQPPFHSGGTDAANAPSVRDSRGSKNSFAPSPRLAQALQTATVWETGAITTMASNAYSPDSLKTNLLNTNLGKVAPLNPISQPGVAAKALPINFSPNPNGTGVEVSVATIPELAAPSAGQAVSQPVPQTAVNDALTPPVQTSESTSASTPRSGTSTSDSPQPAAGPNANSVVSSPPAASPVAPTKTTVPTPTPSSAISTRGQVAHGSGRAGAGGSASLPSTLSNEPSKGDLPQTDLPKAVLGNPLSQESAANASASAQTQPHLAPTNAKLAASVGSPLGTATIKPVHEKRNTASRAGASGVPAAQDPSTAVLGGTREATLGQDSATATETANPVALPEPAATHKDFSSSAALADQPDTRNAQGVLDSAPLAPVQGESAAEGIRAGTLGNILGAKNSGTSELRLNWKTDAFGRIDLHTIVSDNRVGVTLHSERGDLRGVLGAESARFDANLQRHDLHLREFLLTGRETAPSMNFSGGQNQAESRHGPPDRQAASSTARPGNVGDRDRRPDRTASTLQGGGLSVHV